jgi:dienelactone hydrolase
MAEIVLFHSVLGVRSDVTGMSERMRSAGHVVHLPDLYDGKVFDDYPSAFRWLEEIGGIPELANRSRMAVAGMPEELVYAGSSNGGLAAEMLAATRPGALGAVLMHAAAPPAVLGASEWPGSVPVQVHYAVDDMFRRDDALEAFGTAVRDSGAEYELFEYDIPGHLITDPDLPDEYDKDAAALLVQRVLDFLERVDRTG